MPGFVHEHLRPLMGSAGLHLALLALLGAAALRWTSSQPPPPLAIEGYVAAEQPARPATAVKTPKPKPAATPLTETRPEPVVDREEQRRADEAAERRAAAEAEARAAKAREAREREVKESAARELEARQAREQAAAKAERKRAQDAERKRVADADAKRKAAEEEARKKAAAEEARRSADAKQRAEREAEMRRQMEAEEEVAAVARSGVMDDYRRLLVQTIERSWNRPPSARAGLECTLYVSQAPGGTVIDVKLGACNGDQAVRESITNAVYRASPLPAPSDPRAFERRLEIVFKPTE